MGERLDQVADRVIRGEYDRDECCILVYTLLVEGKEPKLLARLYAIFTAVLRSYTSVAKKAVRKLILLFFPQLRMREDKLKLLSERMKVFANCTQDSESKYRASTACLATSTKKSARAWLPSTSLKAPSCTAAPTPSKPGGSAQAVVSGCHAMGTGATQPKTEAMICFRNLHSNAMG